MRGIADGADEPVPSTIDDAGVLDALRPVLRRLTPQPPSAASAAAFPAARTHRGALELTPVMVGARTVGSSAPSVHCWGSWVGCRGNSGPRGGDAVRTGLRREPTGRRSPSTAGARPPERTPTPVATVSRAPSRPPSIRPELVPRPTSTARPGGRPSDPLRAQRRVTGAGAPRSADRAPPHLARGARRRVQRADVGVMSRRRDRLRGATPAGGCPIRCPPGPCWICDHRSRRTRSAPVTLGPATHRRAGQVVRGSTSLTATGDAVHDVRAPPHEHTSPGCRSP